MIRLIVPIDVLDTIYRHADAERPNESCGFLAGHVRERDGCVVESIPIVNELRSPIAYRTEARSLFAAYGILRDRRFDLMAVYHSHPKQPAIPSRRDREEWTYGDTPCVIVGRVNGQPELRVWQLHPDRATELELEITTQPSLVIS